LKSQAQQTRLQFETSPAVFQRPCFFATDIRRRITVPVPCLLRIDGRIRIVSIPVADLGQREFQIAAKIEMDP